MQRWRLTLRRTAESADLNQRDLLACWATTLRAAGLSGSTSAGAASAASTPPVGPDGTGSPTVASAPPAPPEPKLVFAAPLPLRTTADRELVDLIVSDRLTSADLRARLTLHLPPGHELVDLYDVWVGEPALPGLVVAADYRVAIRPSAVPGGAHEVGPAPAAPIDLADLDQAILEVLAAEVILRERAGKPALNIRPLVIGITRDRSAVGAVLDLRLRLDPTIGSGRPEDVVVALGSSLRRPLEVVTQHRTRLWLRGELADEPTL